MTQGIYQFLYENLSLQVAGILLGIGLIAVHLGAYLNRELLEKHLAQFPRHRMSGIVLLLVCTVWCYILIAEMDMGEFFNIRHLVKLLLPISFFLVLQYVPEFLAVRAIGVLMLLAAGPLLNAAFLKPPFTRLLLPILAYAWIFVGIFWIGMPYLMRDWIDWLLKGGKTRWDRLCFGGMGYGALTLLCALAFWGKA